MRQKTECNHSDIINIITLAKKGTKFRLQQSIDFFFHPLHQAAEEVLKTKSNKQI